MIAIYIQKFLIRKLKTAKLSRKDFAELSGISYRTICDLLTATKPKPELMTIIKIADSFNCSVDEVINRKKFNAKPGGYKTNLSTAQIMNYLRKYLTKKVHEHSITPSKLSRTIRFSSASISEFIKDNASQKTLGSIITIALADYFAVSVDEMIGRTTINQSKDKVYDKEMSL